ncbi:MAG: SxtJ family membrane protein [Gemmatimonadota bacterium]|nr:SxtJ family membrane protein [Gemmatimonadota bacterium]
MAHGIPARLRSAADYTAADGRRFALTVGGAFAVLALILVWREHRVLASVLGSLAVLLALGGLTAPRRLLGVERNWMRFAFLLSRVTTPIFMGIVYYLVITPTGIIRRLFGKNATVHVPTGPGGGYWASHDRERRGDMTRQF